MKKIFLFLFVLLGLSSFIVSQAKIESYDGNIEYVADANTGSTTSQNSNSSSNTKKDKETNNSNGSVNEYDSYSSTQKSAYQAKQDIRNLLSTVMSRISLGNSIQDSSYAGTARFGAGKLSNSNMRELIKSINSFHYNLKKSANDNENYNNNIRYHETLTEPKTPSDWKKLSKKEKEETIKKIIEKEEHKKNNSNNQTTNKQNNNLSYPSSLPILITNPNPQTNTIKKSNEANIIKRKDLIEDGIWDSDTFEGLMNTLQNYNSNAMNDFVAVNVIEDCHISQIDLKHQTKEDYDLDDGKIIMEYTLTNKETKKTYKRKSNSNSIIFTNLPEGSYSIQGKQLKKVTKSKRIYYDKRRYMFDTATQTLLSCDDSKVGNSDNYVDIGVKIEYIWENFTKQNYEVIQQGTNAVSGTQRIE